MYIRSIQLDNFKSFGEVVTIPFLSGFTAVSGPNGSGKSNIIDSLLFAFGLSTNKTMRAERLTDLMNNLSGKSETSVSVTLYNDSQQTETIVSRRIRLRKNNQYDSQYFIDNKPSTLSNVHNLLESYNISPNGYNVVMQGDVTRIISMSALERRKIIDELAGVAQFDRKIDAAKEEIESALDSLHNQTILLSEFSDQVEKLKHERDTALKYQTLKTNRNNLELILRHIRIKELEDSITSIDHQIGQHSTQKLTLANELSSIEQEIFQKEHSISQIKEKIHNITTGDKAPFIDKLDTLKSTITRTESNIQYTHKQINDHQKQIELNQKENIILEDKITHTNQQISALNNDINSLETDIQELESRYQLNQQQIKQKSENLQHNSVTELQQELHNLQIKLSELSTEKAIIQEKLSQINTQNIEYKTKLEASIHQANSISQPNSDLSSNQLESKITYLSDYINTLKNEKQQIEIEVQTLNKTLNEHNKSLSKLEMQKQLSEDNNYGRTINAILNHNDPGIHGVLSQLASTEQCYNTALEIAGGARLRSIVVDNDKIAQKLIEYLRQHRLGRATFLPLNKFQQAGSPPRLPHAHGVVDWAVNLLDYDDLYFPLFSYVFGNTLIVDNLSNARTLLGQYRIVTLEGDLLDKSGAMTGGSQKSTASNITFGNQENNQISYLSTQIQNIEAKISRLQQSNKDIQNEIQETEKELNTHRQKWSEIKTTENVQQSQIQTIHTEIEQLKSKLQNNALNRDELESKLESIDQTTTDLDNKIHLVSDNILSESNKIKDSGLEDLINESQEIEYEKKKKNVNLQNLQYQKISLSKEIQQHTDSIQQKHTESEKSQKSIQSLKDESEKQNNNLLTYKNELLDLQVILENIEKELSSLQTDSELYSKQLIQLAENRTLISEKIKNLTNSIGSLKIKLSDLQNRLSLLQNVDESQEIEIQALIEQEKHTRKVLKLSENALKQDLVKIEKQMHNLEPVNMKAIDEYATVLNKLTEIKTKCENLQKEKEEIEQRIGNYTSHKLESFMTAFNAVNDHFQDIFAELSFGQGELLLENPQDPFEGGLYIKARPRNKKMQRLESMSGGEKSLTALSFLFALQWYNPAPFYAFDEVDMFLDGLNVERLSKMIQKQSRLAQFIIVSLRKPMLEKSDRIVGICQGRNSYSSVSGINTAHTPVPA